MPLRNTDDRWGWPAQALHWAVALLVIAMVAIGLWMVDLPLGVEKLELYGLHKSLGVTVFVLVVGRLLWRVVNPTPRPLGPASPLERTLARLVHGAFYAVLLSMPLAGWIMSSAANFSVSVFGLFTLPDLVGPDKELQETARSVHEILGWALIGLFVLHIGGAAKHAVVWRDGTFARMIPGLDRRATD